MTRPLVIPPPYPADILEIVQRCEACADVVEGALLLGGVSGKTATLMVEMTDLRTLCGVVRGAVATFHLAAADNGDFS